MTNLTDNNGLPDARVIGWGEGFAYIGGRRTSIAWTVYEDGDVVVHQRVAGKRDDKPLGVGNFLLTGGDEVAALASAIHAERVVAIG